MTRITRFILAGIILTFISCIKPHDKRGEYLGEKTTIGNGFFETFAFVDNFAKPKAIGFTINTGALEGLPDSSHGHSIEYQAMLPAEAHRTPFTHVVINWNPGGHVPPGIYDKPHFDFHFYMTSPEERTAIPAYEVAPAKFENQPAKAYLPAHYVMAPGGEPKMGAHWVDTTYKEFTGGGFSETFVYGSYDGRVNFIEPMITYDFMKNLSSFARTIPQPAKVDRSGYYPKNLRIVKGGDEYTFYLENFVYREAQ